MINVKLNNKGVSLPLVVGLVLLLMLASVAINELVIRALRSAHQIEASDRAYFSAEAGIEDALYELSEHFAGYETFNRHDDFDGDIDWNNDWEITNLSDSSTFGSDDGLYFYPKQKLIISLYNDSDGTGITTNSINESNADITTLSASNFSITFKIPWDTDMEYSLAYSNGLTIDNDGDLGKSLSEGPESINGLNEDGPAETAICDEYPSKDGDCDGREDEDSNQDPVILWKITDNAGNSLIPIRGCLTGIDGDSDDPLGTEICEKDFEMDAGYLSVTLDTSDEGINQDDEVETIGTFLSDMSSLNNKLQFEFLIIAPLVQAYEIGSDIRSVSIPYLEYQANISPVTNPPLPYFTINSDGWYKDYKQSITTTVTPKTAVPLFDFTIIQQQ